MRQPWQRSDENFLRWWLAAGLRKHDGRDCLGAAEGSLRPTDGLELKGPDGSAVNWHRISASGTQYFDDFRHARWRSGLRSDTVNARKPARQCCRGQAAHPIWVNGKLV
jgi:hypothetical protein